MAACKLRDVFCHATGASIQPRGLSIAMTARSSYKIGIGSQSGNSMKLGLAISKMSFDGNLDLLHFFDLHSNFLVLFFYILIPFFQTQANKLQQMVIIIATNYS